MDVTIRNKRRLEERVALMTLAELQCAHLRLFGKPAINASRKSVVEAVIAGLRKNSEKSEGHSAATPNSTQLIPCSPSREAAAEYQRATLSYGDAHREYLSAHSPEASQKAMQHQRRLQASGVVPHYAQPSASSSASVSSRMLLWAAKAVFGSSDAASSLPSDSLERTFVLLSPCHRTIRRREAFLSDPLKWDPAVAYAESALRAAAALKHALKPHMCSAFVDYNSGNSPHRKGRKPDEGETPPCELLIQRRYAAVERQQSMWNLSKFVEQGPSYLVAVWRGKFDPVTLQREYNGQYIIPSVDYLRDEIENERRKRKLSSLARQLAAKEGGSIPSEVVDEEEEGADPMSDVPTPAGYDAPEPSDTRFAPALDVHLNPATNTLSVKVHLSEAQIRELASNMDRGADGGDMAASSGATFLFKTEFVCLTTDVWIGVRGPWKGQILHFLRKTVRTSSEPSARPRVVLTTPPIGPALSLPGPVSRKLNRQRLATEDIADDDVEAASQNASRGTSNYLGLLSSHSDIPPIECVIVGIAGKGNPVYCFEKQHSSRAGNLDDPFKCVECGNLRRANNIVYTGKDGSTLCRGRYYCMFCQKTTAHLHISGESDCIRRPWRGAVGQLPVSSGVLDEAPFRGVSVLKPTNRTWVGNPLI